MPLVYEIALAFRRPWVVVLLLGLGAIVAVSIFSALQSGSGPGHIHRVADLTAASSANGDPISQPETSGLAIAPDGAILVADRVSRVIWRMTPRGQVTRFAGTGVPGQPGNAMAARDAPLQGPTSVTVDATGQVFFVDYAPPPSQPSVWRIGGDGRLAAVSNGFAQVRQLAIGGDGTVYMAGGAGDLVAVRPDGQNEMPLASVARGLYVDFPGSDVRVYAVNGIAVDGNGNVFVSDRANRQVVELSGGRASRVATTSSNQELTTLTAGPDGRIYGIDGTGQAVVVLAEGRVGHVTHSAGILDRGARFVEGGRAADVGLPYPQAVAVDARNNVYIGQGSTVYRVDGPVPSPSAWHTDPGTAGLAVGSAGIAASMIAFVVLTRVARNRPTGWQVAA